MQKQELQKQLIRYAQHSPLKIIIGTVIIILSSIVLLLDLITRQVDMTFAFFFTGLSIALGSLSMLTGIAQRRYLNDTLQKLEKNSAEKQKLLSDFDNGNKNDRIILGNNYIIGRHTGTVVPYEQISRVYQYVHSTNGFDDSKILKATLFQGRTVDLCKLPLRDKNNIVVEEIIGYILHKNHEVYIGFRNKLNPKDGKFSYEDFDMIN
ncbi:MAG: hypothetical protein IJU14_08485 [Clostridia bacterium]|nr:hypothetical protein [Clostridia bacterium]